MEHVQVQINIYSKNIFYTNVSLSYTLSYLYDTKKFISTMDVTLTKKKFVTPKYL